MTPAIRAMAAAIALSLLAGCSSPEYIISTTSGVMIPVRGEPKVDEKTGMYRYKDADGRTATIKKEEVKQIIER